MKKAIIFTIIISGLIILTIIIAVIVKFNLIDGGIDNVCSLEAKICPDGTSVSRSGPNCEFPACPPGTTPIIQNPYQDLIQVSNPSAGEIVGSPLVVSGIAKGSWYFEASFPVRFFDDKGQELSTMPAQAQGNWMTENFVPFIATLNFDPAGAKSGKLVFHNDNPSGLPENDKSFEVPVTFSEEMTSVKVYFGRPVAGDMDTECEHVVAVGRNVPKTSAIARAAMEQLLSGPTDGEKELGYITSINPGVTIQKLTIENSLAKIDLSAELEKELGGSCRVAAISAQIRETLKQFSTVSEVLISVDGRTEDILQT